jgi:uncharacterized protein (UPF0212 family)
MSICPHCKNKVTRVFIEVVTLNDEQAGDWRGITYSCPVCDSVLSVSFDPVAMETDLVKRVLTALRTGSES